MVELWVGASQRGEDAALMEAIRTSCGKTNRWRQRTRCKTEKRPRIGLHASMLRRTAHKIGWVYRSVAVRLPGGYAVTENKADESDQYREIHAAEIEAQIDGSKPAKSWEEVKNSRQQNHRRGDR